MWLLAEPVNVSPPTCAAPRQAPDRWRLDRAASGGAERRPAQRHAGTRPDLVEVSLDKQGSEHLDAFEARAVAHDAVQQCWRVSPGPDFVLVVQAADMPHYLAISSVNLFTQDANVRNVKAFFATKRAKFTTTWPVSSSA